MSDLNRLDFENWIRSKHRDPNANWWEYQAWEESHKFYANSINSLKQENAELTRLYSEALDANQDNRDLFLLEREKVQNLERIIAESQKQEPLFELLHDANGVSVSTLMPTNELRKYAHRSELFASPVIQEGMQYEKGASEERARLAKMFDEAGWHPYAELIRKGGE